MWWIKVVNLTDYSAEFCSVVRTQYSLELILILVSNLRGLEPTCF